MVSVTLTSLRFFKDQAALKKQRDKVKIDTLKTTLSSEFMMTNDQTGNKDTATGYFETQLLKALKDVNTVNAYIASFVAFKADGLNGLCDATKDLLFLNENVADDSKVQHKLTDYLDRGRLKRCSYFLFFLVCKCLAVFTSLSTAQGDKIKNELFGEGNTIVGCKAIYETLHDFIYMHNVADGKFYKMFTSCGCKGEGGEGKCIKRIIGTIIRTVYNIGLDNLTSLMTRDTVVANQVTMSMLKDKSKNYKKSNTAAEATADSTASTTEIAADIGFSVIKRWQSGNKTPTLWNPTLPPGWRNLTSAELKAPNTIFKKQVIPKYARTSRVVGESATLSPLGLCYMDRKKRKKEMNKMCIL